MFGKRKHFLRIENRIINLDKVRVITGREDSVHVYFSADDFLAIKADAGVFERIASALKHGKVKA
jgi:hypothetical protein